MCGFVQNLEELMKYFYFFLILTFPSMSSFLQLTLAKLQKNFSVSLLKERPENCGLVQRPSVFHVFNFLILSLSHSFQLSLQALISQWFLRNLSALPQLHNVHALHFCHQQHLGEKIWSEPLESQRRFSSHLNALTARAQCPTAHGTDRPAPPWLQSTGSWTDRPARDDQMTSILGVDNPF